ncbi:MAG: hypothetical protein LBS27_09740 [Bifidobacteriaceae bacterium]|nr:hypothetical protein [Bifidobacteriaceae bacterium]
MEKRAADWPHWTLFGACLGAGFLVVVALGARYFYGTAAAEWVVAPWFALVTTPQQRGGAIADPEYPLGDITFGDVSALGHGAVLLVVLAAIAAAAAAAFLAAPASAAARRRFAWWFGAIEGGLLIASTVLHRFLPAGFTNEDTTWALTLAPLVAVAASGAWLVLRGRRHVIWALAAAMPILFSTAVTIIPFAESHGLIRFGHENEEMILWAVILVCTVSLTAWLVALVARVTPLLEKRLVPAPDSPVAKAPRPGG